MGYRSLTTVSRWGRVVVAMVGLCLSSMASASLGSARLPFVHTAWGAAQGAPSSVHAIAQDRDGFLLLGTGRGLYRFDGNTFERLRLADGTLFPVGDITALYVAANGDLWVGYLHEGIARIHDGVVIRYATDAINLHGWVERIAQTPDGTVWAAGLGALMRFDGSHWSRVDATWNYPNRQAGDLLVAPNGTLWVPDGERLRFLRAGKTRFEETHVLVRAEAQLARSPDGTLWISGGFFGLRALPGISEDHPEGTFGIAPRALYPISMKRLLFDNRGQLWGAMQGLGVLGIVADPYTKASGRLLERADLTTVLGKSDGMTSGQPLPSFEDREGTVWVGTSAGLDSFRPAPAQAVYGDPSPDENTADIRATSDGTMWLGTNSTLYEMGKGSTLVARAEFKDGPYDAMVADHAGQLWFLFPKRVARFTHGAWSWLPEPPRSDALAARDRAIQPDEQGGVYLSVVGVGVLHGTNGVWRQLPCLSGEHTSWEVMRLATGGDLWVGGLDGRVARYDPATDRCVMYPTRAIGEIWTIDADGTTAYVGGQRGVARVGPAGVEEREQIGGVPLVAVTGMVRTAGRMWINSGAGVVAVDDAGFNHAFDGPAVDLRVRTYTAADGLPGAARQADPNTLAVDTRGRLLIASDEGPAILDPADIHENHVAPVAVIRAVASQPTRDGETPDIRLPIGSTQMRIAYTAASLAAPTRVTFRYRLEGVDTAWQEAGNRREAFYTNLAPGAYRFMVSATNEDGIASVAPAEVRIVIPPAFYETLWFRLACGVAALLVLVAGIRLRMRRTHEAMRLQFEAASAERLRIARELHDTLLQSVQGVGLLMTAASQKLADDHPAHGLLSRAVVVADAAIIEGREAVQALRSDEGGYAAIDELIAVLGRDLQRVYDTPFVLDALRPVAIYEPGPTREVVAIVREALTNAFRHGRASAVTCRVEARARRLVISVSDDGIGFIPCQDAARSSHFGVRGMYERAARLRAVLTIQSAPGQGTRVTLIFRPLWFVFLGTRRRRPSKSDTMDL